MSAPIQDPRAMTLSASAARRIGVLTAKPEYLGMNLRLSVSGGGCSGFSYAFSFDDATTGDDHVFERDGVKLVVDDCSLDLLAGAELDYVESLMGSHFAVKNPNAVSSCGCGTSFSAG